jgi:hypothetical protein
MTSPQPDLDWLILGGGPHGVHLAARLLGEKKVDPARLRLVDPAPRLLARWRACTERVAMRHLRSPSVHHLDLDPWSLHNFAKRGRYRKRDPFAPPYHRPSLALFNDHSEHVIQTYALDALHLRARAQRIEPRDGGFCVHTDLGPIWARRLLLAMGASDHLALPDWATPALHPHIHHIYEPAPLPDALLQARRVVIVGGGISAGQAALALQRRGVQVHLLSDHPLREHQFDSDPGWLGPKFMAGFSREHDLARRRALIRAARHRGSMPPDVYRAVTAAIARKKIRHHIDEVDPTRDAPPLHLPLRHGQDLAADLVLLATGFQTARPGGDLLDDLIQRAAPPLAPCGYPALDHNLRWLPNLFVTGPLAELQIGPVSRNIAGARRAADLILAAS